MTLEPILDDSGELVRWLFSWAAYCARTRPLPSRRLRMLEKQLVAILKHLELGYMIARSGDLSSFPEMRPDALQIRMIKGQSRIVVKPGGGVRPVVRHRSRASSKFVNA